MSFSATSAGITLPELAADVLSVDIRFSEERVWSIDLSAGEAPQDNFYPWPAPILPYLVGGTRVVLAQSGSDDQLASVDVMFTDDDVVTRVLGADGVPLALNKWGRLGKTLDSGNVGIQDRILDRTTEVITHLESLGLRPFVVGGTLLGGVRDESLLPHDDDADVAYLSHHTNPVEVAAEGFAVGRELTALGYEIVRHSATHMQLYFRSDAGQLDYYVDVFAAFFTEDGNINQPFHVRGEMRRDQMLPFGTVNIQGRTFPAPAEPDAWLVINYDENWRTPIPGYRLATPRATVRRFQNWFGSFHHMRDFWNDRYQVNGARADDAWQSGREWLLAQDAALTSPDLIDLGAGAGALGAELRDRRADRRVVSADYSPYALSLAEEHGPERFQTAHVNLYRNLALLLPLDSGIQGPFDIVANHLMDHLGPHAFPQAMRLIRMALRSGGNAYATLYGERDDEGPSGDPTAWAIEPELLQERAESFGLVVETFPITAGTGELARAPYGVRFTTGHKILKENE